MEREREREKEREKTKKSRDRNGNRDERLEKRVQQSKQTKMIHRKQVAMTRKGFSLSLTVDAHVDTSTRDFRFSSDGGFLGTRKYWMK